MPIHRLLDGETFGPDHIQAMSDAYERALALLGLKDRSDPLTEIVAKKIIEMAQTGERNVQRLSEEAIEKLGVPFTLPAKL
jgi:hypothetical protein